MKQDMEDFRRQERFLARDMIDLARERRDDYGVLESLSDFCFEIMSMISAAGLEDESGVDWGGDFCGFG